MFSFVSMGTESEGFLKSSTSGVLFIKLCFPIFLQQHLIRVHRTYDHFQYHQHSPWYFNCVYTMLLSKKPRKHNGYNFGEYEGNLFWRPIGWQRFTNKDELNRYALWRNTLRVMRDCSIMILKKTVTQITEDSSASSVQLDNVNKIF